MRDAIYTIEDALTPQMVTRLESPVALNPDHRLVNIDVQV